MTLSKAVAGIALIGTLNACGFISEYRGKTEYVPVTAPQKETEIYLQEPFTRVIARCYATAEYAADACAKTFEQKGYVRFSNIPYKTARYDFLTKDTYPTRRWREHERTPRW
ncbi:MAG: hypothetical protein IJ545_03975 [Alphaproteobacteria bacterium]|nr:hypothetical protein [Alphaproteobacteria bacterium]